MHSCVGAHKIAFLRMTQNPETIEDTLTSYLDKSKCGKRGGGRANGDPPSLDLQCFFLKGNYLAWDGIELAFRKNQRQSSPLCPALKRPESRQNRFLSQLDS